jgi:hypothetical protein
LIRAAGAVAAGAMLLVSAPGVAQAQDDPNPGALTFTGGVDVPSLYVFRGLVQEGDAGFTMFPYGDLGIALGSSDGGVKSVGVNIGTWHSLNTGSSGSDGFGSVHYEEDFYATLALGFGGGYSLGTTYTAYTSPNGAFSTVKEINFKVTKADWLAPYGQLAVEVGGDGSGDGGEDRGTYLELGVGPAFALGSRASLTVPVKIGLSLSDYYELGGNDHTFGFFDVGALVTIPLAGVPGAFGSWNIHGGADVYVLGDTPKAFNSGDRAKVVGLIGIGVTY